MSRNKKQVVVIHGGDVFDSEKAWMSYLKNEKEPRFASIDQEDWKDTLQADLGDEFSVIQPSMPNKQNAKYEEWKIWFEKYIPSLNNEIILVGHSLGGVFLAKYLSENRYSKNIQATFLVAAPFLGKDKNFSLDEDLSLLSKQSKQIFLYHSKDDPVVPFADFYKYQEQLPKASARVFEDREHFNEKLPEIVEDIRGL